MRNFKWSYVLSGVLHDFFIDYFIHPLTICLFTMRKQKNTQECVALYRRWFSSQCLSFVAKQAFLVQVGLSQRLFLHVGSSPC